tara:strand:+ start:20077 stop:21267 length:1191 start_codon:yes stop_codon:yes gene_type:complete
MNNILDINNKNLPKAIIDYANKKKDIVFDFDEVIYMNQDGNIFINGKNIDGDPLNIWQTCIDKWKKNKGDNEISALGFFSYDFKNILYPNYQFENHRNSKTPYFWFGKPSSVISTDDYKYNYEKQNIKLNQNLLNLKDFDKIINQIKTYLYNGDVYQINFTQPLIYEFIGNALDLYVQIKDISEPQFGFFLDIDDIQCLSFTPEKFFTKNKNYIKSYPIKGTIKKEVSKEKDFDRVLQLQNSSKDKAEHLMIVDLLRNDLGKICKFGSVEVNDIFNVKTFKTIHHMESEVIGIPKEKISEIEIIKSIFPGGSITGAPKFRAIQLIDDLENYNRALYTGCIGTIMGNGDMDFNICIRTMTIEGKKATYPVGGGIVWDSKSELEYNEAKEKANILSQN